MRKTSSALLISSLALIQGTASGQESQAKLSFTGVWLLDERESDDLEEKLEEISSTRTNGVGWGGSWPGGGSRQRPSSGRSGRGSANPGRREGPYDQLARGLRVLRIDHQERLISIRNANRENRLLPLDGSVITDGLGSRTVIRLGNGTLVVETQADRGQLVETYELAPSGTQLVLTTDIQGDRTPDLRFRTVYERIDDPELQANSGTPERARTAEVATLVAADPPQVRARPEPPAAETETPEPRKSSVIRLLPIPPSPGKLLSGKVLLQTLTIDPGVTTVEFYLDGEKVAHKKLPPFDAKVELASPPREQRVRVSALGVTGRSMGSDQITINRVDPPFRLNLVSIEGDTASGSVRASAEVSVPRRAVLEEVAFYRGESLVTRLNDAPFVADIPTEGVSRDEYVRVTAKLRDGRELEDVELLVGADFSAEVDVHLVQLQVLVTDRSGAPVAGLTQEDFEIVEGGKTREVQRLYMSRDVALVLGLAIDSSGSMIHLWQQTRGAAEAFLDGTLGARDRAFLVDFDSQLRLLQPLTGNTRELYSALGQLRPQGNTALYDSILFSMLQFDGEPGRRALIVITDGFDSASRADPSRAVDFGQRLGVPVYIISMAQGQGGGFAAAGRGGSTGGFSNQALATSTLSVITEPTGGRLFRAGTGEQVVRAFSQIRDELRMQYILTYYTDRAPEEGAAPVVKVRRKGLKVKTALPLDLAN